VKTLELVLSWFALGILHRTFQIGFWPCTKLS
jgi:hypothetical protein